LKYSDDQIPTRYSISAESRQDNTGALFRQSYTFFFKFHEVFLGIFF
jgi:hypothetical protein